MLSQNLVLQSKFKKISYQSFDCYKTNFTFFVRESISYQMLVTQWQNPLQESHSIINELAGNLSNLNAMP